MYNRARKMLTLRNIYDNIFNRLLENGATVMQNGRPEQFRLHYKKVTVKFSRLGQLLIEL